MGKILLGVGLVDGTDVEEIDGHETPQNHTGVRQKFFRKFGQVEQQNLLERGKLKPVSPVDSSNGWVRRRRLGGGGLESLLSSL